MVNSKLYPESWQIEPMRYAGKVSDLQARQAFESGNYVAQEKKDGALYQLEKTDSGYVYMFSRTKSRKTGELVEKSDNFQHIKEWAKFYLPNGTILIGEVYVPGGHSNDVTKLSGCLPTKALNRQFNEERADVFIGPARYYVFDIIRFKGEDLRNKGTLDRIENYLYNERLEYSFISQQYIERAETIYDNFEEHLNNIFKSNGEGIVVKKKDCPYRAGMRSTPSQMFKWKKHLDSIDFICIGIEDPEYYYTGKEAETWPYKDEEGNLITKLAYNGWAGSISLGCYKDGKLVNVGKVSSGLTDNMRKDLVNNPDKYIGQVVQISCMSVDPKEGTIRHPVLECFRFNDKNPEECLYEEIFK